MLYRVELSLRDPESDARSHAIAQKLDQHWGIRVETLYTRDVYTLDLDLDRETIEAIAQEISNPVTQQYRIDAADADCHWLVMVGFRPGVTDNIARTLQGVIEDLIGRKLHDHEAVFSHVEYLFAAPAFDETLIGRIARELLGNPLIHNIRLIPGEAARRGDVPENTPRVMGENTIEVRQIDLEVSDEELMEISRRGILALSLEEMQAIQRYFREHANDEARRAAGLGPQPTDVELECIAQSWSEHCSHKIFSAQIEYEDTETGERRTIAGLFKSFIRQAT
ncbi:MAG: phosphoribosylformylglycinamidine synthase, partial [Lentisphaerae bacterium]